MNFLKFPYMEDELRSRLAEGFNKCHGAERFKHFTANIGKFDSISHCEYNKMLQKHKDRLGISDCLYIKDSQLCHTATVRRM